MRASFVCRELRGRRHFAILGPRHDERKDAAHGKRQQECAQPGISAGDLGDGHDYRREMTTLRRVQIMTFSSFVVVSPVRFFLKVTGVWRAIDYACHRAGVLLDDAKTLVIANET